MMKRNGIIAIAVIVILIFSFSAYYIFNNQNKVETKLVIYGYTSLFQDPGYNFVGKFESLMNLPHGSVKLVLYNDAGSVLSAAISEKSSPVADVLIGIDNALVNEARVNNVLEPYRPNGYQTLLPNLVSGLAPDYLLTPYDYGVMSLWYQKGNLTGSLDPNTFLLSDLPNFANQTIVENPSISTPGLAFLLHTIAIYGDPSAGITGVVQGQGDWQQYWTKLVQNNIRIVPSWNDAYNLMYTPQEGRPMMVSYTSSPAYDYCLYGDNSTVSVLSHENNQTWGWEQIEGIGLVKNAVHKTLAEKFIDFFISNEVQSQVYENQWVYPAVANITTPSCYSVAIPFNQIKPLNSYISLNDLATNLNNWLNEWDTIVASK